MATNFLSTRPPVTAHEATTLELISNSIAASATYHLEGRISKAYLPDKPYLMYMMETETGRVTGALPFFTATRKDLEGLHETCISSHCDQNENLVKDQSYSHTRELAATNFLLDTAIIPMAAVSSFCQRGVEVRRHKLSSYTDGGFCKANKNIRKGGSHLGTLIIGLPTPYEGGRLVLRQGAQSTTLDWSTKGRDGEESLLWTFFYSNVRHEILPITAGHCLILVFDVFITDFVRYRTPISLQTADVKNTALYTNFRRALRDAEFLPNGGRLAFGLAHGYPHVDLDEWRPFDAILTGTDRILWQVLTELGMVVHAKAAYKITEEASWEEDILERTQEEEEEDRYQVDAFNSAGGPGYPLMTSDSFSGISSEVLYQDAAWSHLREDVSAEVEWDLIWVMRPERYVDINPHTVDCDPYVWYVFVAGALLIDVPPAAEGCRAMTAP